MVTRPISDQCCMSNQLQGQKPGKSKHFKIIILKITQNINIHTHHTDSGLESLPVHLQIHFPSQSWSTTRTKRAVMIFAN